MMDPGERVEIVVDLTGDAPGSAVLMQSFDDGERFGNFDGEDQSRGTSGDSPNRKISDVLRIKVGSPTANAITSLPT